jgi:CRISPR/Cas system CSM-associated protein Csm3 (group 7 of RAMP superfamily)
MTHADADPSGCSVLHVVRVTIEATSPMSARSGDLVWVQRAQMEDGKKSVEKVLEVALVRDSNGLPTIPGATLQGVLHHLYRADQGDTKAKEVFGFAQEDEGDAGRLTVGFGCVHNSVDCAVVGLAGASDLEDPIVKLLRQPAPVRRDHVTLNARHVADGRKKFERLAVPIGTRFSFELSLWGTAADNGTLADIVGLIAYPAFRIGGAGRRGYGKVRLVRATQHQVLLGSSFDPVAMRLLRAQPPSKPFTGGKNFLDDLKAPDAGAVVATLTLRPINPSRVGGVGLGDELVLTELTSASVRLPDGTAPPPGVDSDLRRDPEGPAPRPREGIATIVREPLIRWTQEGTRWSGVLVRPSPPSGTNAALTPFDDKAPNSIAFVVPGSAIKGPLAHRALFHWNRLQRDDKGERVIDVDAWRMLDDDERKQRLGTLTDRPRELERLLGAAKERADRDVAKADVRGRAARLFVDDATASGLVAAQAIDHNSIDRFSGGVRNGTLYVEEVLVGGEISAEITILPPLDEMAARGGSAGGWDRPTVDAILHALADLCRGRLAIGAKSLGFCNGEVQWSGAAAKESWQSAWNDLVGAGNAAASVPGGRAA